MARESAVKKTEETRSMSKIGDKGSIFQERERKKGNKSRIPAANGSIQVRE